MYDNYIKSETLEAEIKALKQKLAEVGSTTKSVSVISEEVSHSDATNDMDDVSTVSGDVLLKKSFDAYMVLEEDLEPGQLRLLETDNVLYRPS